MSALSLPRPNNLDTRFGDIVEHDLYMIAERVKEVDPSLFIVKHPERPEQPYAIIERCADHVDRLVFRTDTLDGRIVEKLQYLLNVPFEKRFAEAEAKEAQAKASAEAAEREHMYETIGAPMLPLLLKTGAIDSRRESYPLRGVTRGKGSKRNSMPAERDWIGRK